MANTLMTLLVQIGAETSGFKKGIGQVTGDATKMTKTLTGLIPPTIAQYLSLGGAILAVGTALKYATDQAAQSELVNAKLDAVLKSTGGAAGLTAVELDKMAMSLSHVSVYDDEAIKGSEALLLTFTAIGRDVFPQAQQAILDVSSALGQDLQSSTIQIGKALNDPIKGVTALQRVGVSFTADQKKMIESLVKTGDVLGAQKIILDELTKEFGGQAAAAANTYQGSLARLKNEFDNLAETIGKKALPFLDAFLLMLTVDIAGINDLGGAIEALKSGGLKGLDEWRKKIAAPFQDKFLQDLDAMVNGYSDSTNTAITTTNDFGGALGDLVDPAQAAADALQAISDRNESLLSLTQQIGRDNKNYAKDHAQALEDVATAQERVNKTIADNAGYDSIKSATDALNDQKQAVKDLEIGYAENSNTIVYSMTAANAAINGTTNAEFQMLMKLGVALGQFTEADAQQAQGMYEFAQSLAEGAKYQEAVIDGTDNIALATDGITAAQDGVTQATQGTTSDQGTLTSTVQGTTFEVQNEMTAIMDADSALMQMVADQQLLTRYVQQTTAAYKAMNSAHAGGSSAPLPSATNNAPFVTPYSGGSGYSASPSVSAPSMTINITNPAAETSEASIKKTMKNINYLGYSS